MASTDQNQITIDRDYRDKGPAPLYYHYDGQCNSQPAYLEMTEDGAVSVDYSGEIGNAVPAYVWHRRTLRWAIPNCLSPTGIDQLMDDVQVELQTIHDGHSVEWDGSNHVGRLTPEASEIGERLGQRLYECEDYERIAIWDAAEWLQLAWDETVNEYHAAPDKPSYMESLVSIALSDGAYLVNVGSLERRLQDAE